MDLELRSLVAFASGLLLFPVLLIGAVGKPASFVASIWRVREFDFLNVTFLWRQRKPPPARLRSMTTGFSLLSAEIRHFYLPTTPNKKNSNRGQSKEREAINADKTARFLPRTVATKPYPRILCGKNSIQQANKSRVRLHRGREEMLGQNTPKIRFRLD